MPIVKYKVRACQAKLEMSYCGVLKDLLQRPFRSAFLLALRQDLGQRGYGRASGFNDHKGVYGQGSRMIQNRYSGIIFVIFILFFHFTPLIFMVNLS